MNVDILIRWGLKLLAFFDEQQEEKSNNFDQEQLQEKLGWITKFRDNLKEFEDILQIVAEESSKAKPNERLLGSSEVIESVFGKLKQLENNQAKSGFTGLLLSTAAMVSKTTKDVVEKALKVVPTKEVLVWLKDNIGQSLQSMRKEGGVIGAYG